MSGAALPPPEEPPTERKHGDELTGCLIVLIAALLCAIALAYCTRQVLDL